MGGASLSISVVAALPWEIAFVAACAIVGPEELVDAPRPPGVGGAGSSSEKALS